MSTTFFVSIHKPYGNEKFDINLPAYQEKEKITADKNDIITKNGYIAYSSRQEVRPKFVLQKKCEVHSP